MKKCLILGDLVVRADECEVKKWRRGKDEEKNKEKNGDKCKEKDTDKFKEKDNNKDEYNKKDKESAKYEDKGKDRDKEKSEYKDKEKNKGKNKEEYKSGEKDEFKEKEKHKDTYNEKDEFEVKDKNKDEFMEKIKSEKDEFREKDNSKDEYEENDKESEKDRGEDMEKDKYKGKEKDKVKSKNSEKNKDKFKDKNSLKDTSALILISKKAYLKGFAWAYEKFKKEPYFVSDEDKKAYYDKVAARVAKCPHLAECAYMNSLTALPQHFKDTLKQHHSPALWRKDAPFFKVQILAPHLTEKEYFLWAKFCLQKAYGAFDEAQATKIKATQAKATQANTTQKDIDELGTLLDEIYALESECFKTHEALVRLSEPFKALDNFKHNEVKFTGIHSFFDGFIFTKPIYEIISTYPHKCNRGALNEFKDSYEGKYDLLEYDESILKKIEPMKRHLKEYRSWVDESTAWLDERISSQKDFKPRLVLDNPIPSDAQRPFFDFIMNVEERKELLDNIAKEKSVLKQADFEKFTSDEKEKIEQIVQKAKQIQSLITRYRFIYRLKERAGDDVEKLPFPFNIYD